MPFATLRSIVVVACFLLASCATTRLGQGSGRWHRISTEHFTVYTDLAEHRGRAKAQDFERWLSAFQQHGFEITGKLPLRLNVVLFAHKYDFGRHGGYELAGYHVSNVLLEPWIVMSDEAGEWGHTVFRHELTHYLTGLAIHNQPAWYSEGLATYFETAHFEGGKFAIGGIPRDKAAWLVTHRPAYLADVFDPRADRMAFGFYAKSWLIVHYLMTEQPEPFETYQVELAHGRSHQDAWATAFPELPTDALEQRVHSYLRGEAFAKYLLQVQTPEVAATSRALSRADEHALQGLLWATRCDGCTPAREQELTHASMQAALAEDPLQPQAVAWNLLSIQKPSRADVLRAEELARRRPEEWMSWMVLGIVALGADELPRVRDALDPVSALRRLIPDYPYPDVLAAFQSAVEGDRNLALRAAARARRKGASNPLVLSMEAQLLASLGACDELSATLDLLSDIQHNGGHSLSQRAMLELTGECRARAAQTVKQ